MVASSDANHAQARMYGCTSPDAMTGCVAVAWVVPSERTAFGALLASACDSPLDVANGFHLVRQDGSGLVGDVVVQTIRNLEALVTGFICTTRDVSERHRALDGLRPAEFNLTFFKTAIDRSPSAAYWLDSSGGCVYVNDSACRTLGYSRDELQRLTMIDIARGSSSLWDRIFASIKNQGSNTLQSKHYCKDGSTVDVEITSHYLKYGETDYCIGFATDIGDRLRAQREPTNCSNNSTKHRRWSR